MSPRTVADTEPLWRALADPTRRALLDALRAGPRTTGVLAAEFPTTRFAVMKHLGVLVDAGLVTVERRGRERLNHLNPVPLRQAYERWVRPFGDDAATIALRLAGAAEEGTTMTTPTGPLPTPATGPGASPYGLDVRAEHRAAAPVDPTWAALLALATWWPPCWPDGERLAFEPRLGGRLGTVPAGAAGIDDAPAGELWGVVTGLRPGAELVLDGTMGIPGPVAGQWRLTLAPADGGTAITVAHRVLGPVDADTRAGFTTRWPGTLAALATHAEAAA
jgi:DNA-binding transcriptional ArsR family regulator